MGKLVLEERAATHTHTHTVRGGGGKLPPGPRRGPAARARGSSSLTCYFDPPPKKKTHTHTQRAASLAVANKLLTTRWSPREGTDACLPACCNSPGKATTGPKATWPAGRLPGEEAAPPARQAGAYSPHPMMELRYHEDEDSNTTTRE